MRVLLAAAAAATAAKYGFILDMRELTENGVVVVADGSTCAGDVLVDASDGIDCGVLKACGQKYCLTPMLRTIEFWFFGMKFCLR